MRNTDEERHADSGAERTNFTIRFRMGTAESLAQVGYSWVQKVFRAPSSRRSMTDA
jgi:hypothetical protein